MTYADDCLERVEKATERMSSVKKATQENCPSCKHPSMFDGQCINTFCDEYYPIPERSHEKAYAEFVTHSFIDVPELARRLNDTIQRLREAASIIHSEGIIDEVEYEDELRYIATFEAMPVENK